MVEDVSEDIAREIMRRVDLAGGELFRIVSQSVWLSCYTYSGRLATV